MHNILFVGCDTYTARYPRAFADRNFVTIDVDPSKARYGASSHIVDSIVNIGAHFLPDSLDVVVLNGVIGWGLDQPLEIDRVARECFVSLRPGGLFIVGWNDIDPWRPMPLDQLEGFGAFEMTTLPPFPWPTYPTFGDMRHVFSFYRRPEA